MSYWEPPTEDPNEAHVAEAEALLAMTGADVARHAAETGRTVAEVRRWRAKKIDDYRSVNPDELTPDQNRRLFGA